MVTIKTVYYEKSCIIRSLSPDIALRTGKAQEQSVLQIRPTGRILMDGGLFHSDNKNFVDGVAIPDAG